MIHVKDVNDNPPVFERPTYRTQITEEDDRNLPKRVLQVLFSYSSHDFHASHPFVCPTSCCLFCELPPCLPPILMRGFKAFDFLLIFLISPHEKCALDEIPRLNLFILASRNRMLSLSFVVVVPFTSTYLMNFCFDPEGIRVYIHIRFKRKPIVTQP